jgi:hypothetical protein
MRITFACPDCAAAGAVDAAFAGKGVRCKHCGCRFAVPVPGQVESDVYALDESIGETGGPAASDTDLGSAFVPSRGDEANTTAAAPKPKRAARKPSTGAASRRNADSVPRPWLMWSGVAVVLILAAIALFAPQGMLISGGVMTLLGCLMVLAGYAAGAYGAFCEDLLYGILYLLIPLYTGYYIVTRWDDLWAWFTCSTAGVLLILLGVWLLETGGAGA